MYGTSQLVSLHRSSKWQRISHPWVKAEHICLKRRKNFITPGNFESERYCDAKISTVLQSQLLQRNVWRRHIGVPLWDTNMADNKYDWQNHVKITNLSCILIQKVNKQYFYSYSKPNVCLLLTISKFYVHKINAWQCCVT